MNGDGGIGPELQRAALLLSKGDSRGAEAGLRAILSRAPGQADALFMLGAAFAMRGDQAGAINQFDLAIRARPGHVQAMAQKARCLDALDRRAEAVAVAEAVGKLLPDPWSADTAGVVMTRAGKHGPAAELYARAAKTGSAPGYHYNLASALVFLGRFDEARDAFRACLARDPKHGPAWAGLVQITQQTREQNEIPRLTAIVQAMARDQVAVNVLGHAIAKAHEDLGEPAQAMEWLARAKAGMASRLDSAGDAALSEAAIRSLRASVGDGKAAGGPIFVVGLPRSGTTLTDRILSSHSEVTSAGELDDFPMALKAATGVGGARQVSGALIDAAAGVDLGAVGRAYLDRVQRSAGISGRFVDKLPLNIFLAPLILRALPGAKVVCLRRHPADTVLGNYRQAFAETSADLTYAVDLGATARHVARFEGMLAAFVQALPPDRFRVLGYEALVDDFGSEVKRLLDFCGLPFEEACVRFEKNSAPVATPSAAQVREPINARAVGRWRRYRPALDPALEILIEAGVMSRAELA
jgi:tetratricopeptide (TPR) repeat protein